MSQLPNEIWEVVEGFEHYKVSNYGRVYNTRTNRLLQQSLHKKQKEYRVNLTKFGVAKTFSTHRLVAQAFLPGYAPGVRVIHLDGVRTNNHVPNLEVQNWEIKNRREILDSSGYLGRKVRVVDWDETFPSVRALSDHLDTSIHNIYKCLSGKQKQHLGLRFEYVE